jgi:hypothetical protein
MNLKPHPTPIESLSDLEDDIWVELMISSPQSVNNLCMMVTLDIQIEEEEKNNPKYTTN